MKTRFYLRRLNEETEFQKNLRSVLLFIRKLSVDY